MLWQASPSAAVAAVTCAFFALPCAGVWPSQREERSDLIFPAQTDESGIASFSFYTTETGLYKFKIIQVGHPVRDYNPSLNIESTETLRIP